MTVVPDRRTVAVLYVTRHEDQPAELERALARNGIECGVDRASDVDAVDGAIANADVAALVIDADHSDAFDVLERAQSIDANPTTVVVASDEDADIVDRAYEAGADEFVHDDADTTMRVVRHEIQRQVTDGVTGNAPRASEHLEPVSETMRDAIISIDESSVVRYVNPAIEDVLGYEPAEVVGEPLAMLMRDDLAERHMAGLQSYIETGERALNWNQIELYGLHKDGHEVPLSISFSEFTDEGTRFFTGVLRDDTDRRRLEAERELYHDATQRILQADTFEDGLQTGLEAIGAATNWTYGEVWTQNESGTLERVGETYVASDEAREFARRTAHVTFQPGEGLIGRVWSNNDHEWHADVTAGTDAIERADLIADVGFQAALCVPIVSDDTVQAVLAFFDTDVTEYEDTTVQATRTIANDLGHLIERLRVESVVREERALKDRVLETSPVGIIIIGADGSFQYSNDRAREILQIDDDDTVTYDDLGVERVSIDDELPEAERPYNRVVGGGKTVSGEYQLTVDGETRWLAIQGAPLRDDTGTVTSGVFSLQDVTERERRTRRLQQYEAVVETVSDAIYATNADGEFVLVNDACVDLLGYDRDALLGREVSDFVSDHVAGDAQAIQSELEANGGEVTVDTTVTTQDGDQVPVETRVVLFELDDDHYGRAGVVRDVSARKRREERLAKLNEIGQALETAETAGEVADIVVEGALEALECSLVDLQYYDEVDGELASIRRSSALADVVGDASLFPDGHDATWEAFATGEERTFDATDATGGDDDEYHDVIDADAELDPAEAPFENAVVFPVASHGAFVLASTASDELISVEDVRIARILVAHAVAALGRVEREAELREKQAELKEYTASLERINRLNGVIRGLTRELTEAGTREEIETSVCEELATADPYVFGWIGEQRAVADEIVPRTNAGAEDGYLDAITFTSSPGDDGSTDPTGTAFATNEPVVQNNLQTDPPFEEWRTEALKRDFRSSIAIPLSYRDTTYGVLNLYADEPDVFDDMEVAVLTELGEMIGYAINAIERKKALVSDASVELTFSLTDESVPAIRFATETDASFTFDTLIEQTDGTIRAFFTVTGTDPETVYEYGRRSRSVREISLLSEQDDSHRYEAVVAESGFLGDLISYGATPTELTATPSGGRVTVELPKGGDVKSFVRMFVREYENAELVNRTEYDRPVQTRAEFEASYRDRLTERQEEVLQTAYFSGFFEWPRETSGTELATKLGVSQPTVSRHIRKGERKLFSVVFDDE